MLVLCLEAPVTAQPAPLALPAPAGPFAVGVRADRYLDTTRTFPPHEARPLDLLLWYPAASADTSPVRYGEYLDVHAPSSVGDSLRAAALASHPDREALLPVWNTLLATPTTAALGAPPASGAHPLVLLGPGGQTPLYTHALLAAYLASHGYAALALPALGPAEDEVWPFDTTGVRLHLDDHRAALRYARSLPFVDGERVALAAWSVGGVAHVLFASSEPAVRALVSLDGAMGYAYGWNLLRSFGDDAPQRLSVPYLHLRGEGPNRFAVPKSDAFFDTLAATDATLVTFPNLAHPEFASHLGYLRHALAPDGRTAAVTAEFALAARLVRRFVDAYVKGESIEWLSEIPASSSVVVRRKRAER